MSLYIMPWAPCAHDKLQYQPPPPMLSHLCRYDLLNACNGADDQDEDANPLLHVEMEMVIVQVSILPVLQTFTMATSLSSLFGAG